MKRQALHRTLGIISLAVCVLTGILYGFSAKKPSNGHPGRPAGATDELDVLFPRYRVTATPRGEANAPVLELLTPTDGGNLLLRWRDTELSVSRDAVETRPPPERELPEANDGEIMRAAAILVPTATSRYLLWTDLYRLKTYVLERDGDGWRLLRRLPCSAGDAAHPSPSGLFSLGVHRLSFGRKGHYSAAFALQISGSYLYHSVLLTPNGDAVLDGRLGERISHGCIRHSLEDSRWLYETVPDGTAILIR